MLEHFIKLTSKKPGDQEGAIKSIANELGLGKFTDALLETIPPDVNPGDAKQYSNITREVRIQSRQMTIQPGELTVVRYLNDSQILVKTGAKLDVINLKNSKVSYEKGGEVHIFESDKESIVREVIPERLHKICEGCGAPFEGRPQCSWCKRMF